jgi:hypothetical protein
MPERITPSIREENPMRRWLILAAILLSTCSGCGAMEDLILGPSPYYENVAWQPAPTNSCSAPPPIVTTSQTQEPPLLQGTR